MARKKYLYVLKYSMLKEALLIPEPNRRLDNIKASYLSSHIQYRNSVIEIESQIDPEYRNLKLNFRRCVSDTLPYLEKTKFRTGEEVVMMTSLEKPNRSVNSRGNGASHESIKELVSQGVVFLPSTLSYAEVIGFSGVEEVDQFSFPTTYSPVFADKKGRDRGPIYPNIDYTHVFPQVYSRTSLNSINLYLNEVDVQKKYRQNVPNFVEKSLYLVQESVLQYEKKLEIQKSIHAAKMNIKLEQFIEIAKEQARYGALGTEGLKISKNSKYILDVAASPGSPRILKQNGTMFGFIPNWTDAGLPKQFDLSLLAEKVIMKKVLAHEEDHDEVSMYIQKEILKYSK